MNIWSRYIIPILLILLPFFFLNSNLKQRHELAWHDKVILTISSPVQKTLLGITGFVSDIWTNYIYLVDVKQSNYRIKQNNRDLASKLFQSSEIELENQRLRSLLGFTRTQNNPMIAAQVVAESVSNQFKTITIDKGSTHGVLIGMPVLTTEGVVGSILRTYNKASDVMLLIDPNSSVAALSQRSRVRGLIQGTGESQLRLAYVQRLDDVQKEDIILTSGLDPFYPKNLKLGHIDHVKGEPYDIFQQVTVRTAVDFSSLEEVLIVLTTKKNIRIAP